MSFLRRDAGLGPGDTELGELRVEPLLLHVERRKAVLWFGNLIRMPPGCLPLEVFWAGNWQDAQRQTQDSLEGYTSYLGGTPQGPQGGTGERCLVWTSG